jgi:hypothetical protein
MALQPGVGPWPIFQFLNPVHSRQDSLEGGSAHRKAITYTQDNTNTNEYTQTCTPRVGSELTTPVFERGKTVDALDRSATVIGTRCCGFNRLQVQPPQHEARL